MISRDLSIIDADAIPTVVERLRNDILFCASDFPHEPRCECRENIGKFIGREDLQEETKIKILKGNPKRMYGMVH